MNSDTHHLPWWPGSKSASLNKSSNRKAVSEITGMSLLRVKTRANTKEYVYGSAGPATDEAAED
jgi:hypothetical protein